MTYAEILDAVSVIVDRPEMAGAGQEIEKMIQAATLRMHQSDFYSRDLAENTIDLGSLDYTFSFATSTFTRFRALHYLRKTTALADGVASTVLKKLDPKNLFDGNALEKNDVWYNAGANIVVRSSTEIRYLLAGWYQQPVISPVAQYSSWIAETVPHAIIFDACSLIFSMIAQQEQSRKFDGLVAEQVQLVKMHGLDAHGY